MSKTSFVGMRYPYDSSSNALTCKISMRNCASAIAPRTHSTVTLDKYENMFYNQTGKNLAAMLHHAPPPAHIHALPASQLKGISMSSRTPLSTIAKTLRPRSQSDYPATGNQFGKISGNDSANSGKHLQQGRSTMSTLKFTHERRRASSKTKFPAKTASIPAITSAPVPAIPPLDNRPPPLLTPDRVHACQALACAARSAYCLPGTGRGFNRRLSSANEHAEYPGNKIGNDPATPPAIHGRGTLCSLR